MMDRYLIWWTNRADCDRITPLESWPTWLYDEFQNRKRHDDRCGLLVPQLWANEKDVPERAIWDGTNNWLCQAAADAIGIVMPAQHIRHILFLPGLISTFAMELPDAREVTAFPDGWMGRLSALREAGWRVASHNDYRLSGVDMSFWLLTHPSGLYVKGEGKTDGEALAECAEKAGKIFAPSP